MKKIYSLVLLLGIALISYSQTTIKPAIGVNYTDYSGSGGPGGNIKARTGWQVGGTITFGKGFYWEPGLFYVGKSTSFTSTGSPETDADILGFRVPLGVGFQIIGDEKSTFGIRAMGGFSAFFVTSTKNIDKGDINKTLFGVYAGAGVDVWKLFLDLSYEWSLTDTQKDGGSADVGKARSLFISAGIKIHLGK